MAQKINEALEHIAAAEKCLKTGFLKWKPDYDSAASEYAKAAVAFKNAKQYDQAKDAYLREAESHQNNRAFFHAAKAYEQAGMMLKEMQKLPEAVQFIEKASMMFVESGTPDTAAMSLDRAGKLIENINLEKAVDLYQQAASVFEVMMTMLDEAAASLQKEKNMYKEIENYPTCFKKTIAQVLVHLHRNDYVAADKCVRESYSLPGFNGSEDCSALEQLLEGFDQQDQDQVSAICNSPLFKYMDNDYAKLSLSLRVPGGGTKKKSSESQQEAGEPVESATVNEEDDEYSSGLC
ncbi:hypothetical protein chiPu_0005958 [Chiloscyllium punctatum]|uniref:Gamma-soluble NSF attachment protein n=1 Tax=Chiloscyllium punctatum TaxID=137246 RepID=A0A401SAY3_CHIPU|nr:hypothetical protein [Chiloscyllium punctatum]